MTIREVNSERGRWVARRQRIHIAVTLVLAAAVVGDSIAGFLHGSSLLVTMTLCAAAFANTLFTVAWMRPEQLRRRWARQHPERASVLAGVS